MKKQNKTHTEYKHQCLKCNAKTLSKTDNINKCWRCGEDMKLKKSIELKETKGLTLPK